jgi:hypothetical protein
VVQLGFPELTRMLIEAGGPSALQMENGVGETPIEVAISQALRWRIRTKISSGYISLSLNSAPLEPPRFDPTRKSMVEQLKVTLKELVSNGRLRPNTQLYNELFAFADRSDVKLPRAASSSNEPVPKDPKDNKDPMLTLRLVQDAMTDPDIPRSLIHLLEVQRSVQSDLSLGSPQSRADDDGQGVGGDEGDMQRQNSLIFSERRLRAKNLPKVPFIWAS